MDVSNSSKQEEANTVCMLTDYTQNKLSEALKNAVNIVIEKILSKSNYSHFKKCFPDIALEDPVFTRNIHGQLLSQLKMNFMEDLEKFFVEQNVDKKLYELDLVLKNEQIDKKVCWRPSGDPNEDIRDHRCKSKLKHLEKLQTVHQQYEADNEKLAQILTENHEEILLLKRNVFDIEAQNIAKLKILSDNQLSMIEELLCVADEVQ